jgi:hypothetical protein
MGDAVLHRSLNHRQRRFNVTRSVVQTKQQMVVNIDHDPA